MLARSKLAVIPFVSARISARLARGLITRIVERLVAELARWLSGCYLWGWCLPAPHLQ